MRGNGVQFGQPLWSAHIGPAARVDRSSDPAIVHRTSQQRRQRGFDETPEITSRLVHEFAAEGLVNILGGCCGTTPDHIGAIAKAVAPVKTRQLFYREPTALA